VALLLAKGADVNARDQLGRTPLWHAQRGSRHAVDRRATEELLRKHAGIAGDKGERDQKNKRPADPDRGVQIGVINATLEELGEAAGLLTGNNINAAIEGSLVFGIWVSPQHVRKAIQILKASKFKHKMTFY
jgi:hypothetical protein